MDTQPFYDLLRWYDKHQDQITDNSLPVIISELSNVLMQWLDEGGDYVMPDIERIDQELSERLYGGDWNRSEEDD